MNIQDMKRIDAPDYEQETAEESQWTSVKSVLCTMETGRDERTKKDENFRRQRTGIQ
jgi:hypothetical protein